METFRRFLLGVSVGITAIFVGLLPTTARANASINLGAAGVYTVLGLSNVTVNLSNTQIHGDVGVGPHSDLKLMAPTTIYGNVYLDSTSTESASAGTVTGTVFTGQNLLPAVTAALQVSSSAAALTPTLTLGTLTTNYTVVGNGGTNVIDITSLNLNNANLVLSGGPNDLFFINESDGFTLTGTASILEANGAGPRQVLLNLTASGGTAGTHVGDRIDAIILAPYYSLNFDGTFNGEIIGGGVQLGLLSGAIVNGVAVPEPSSYALVLTALGILGVAVRGRAARK